MTSLVNKSSFQHLAMPEFLHRADRQSRPWEVRCGPAVRGAAFTDLVSHRMHIPSGHDETSRCVRAHEMMHAKVSPPSLWRPPDDAHLADDIVTAAEEFRINMLIASAGFPVAKHLADGSETRSGERIGTNAEWAAAVLMTAATTGTRASRAFLTGIRRTRPDWSPPLKAIEARLTQMWRRACVHGLTDVASTELWGESTRGWMFTLEVARYLGSLMTTSSANGSPHTPTRAACGERGQFAEPIVLDLPLPRSISGALRRTRRASPTGRHLRHVDRLLTDPTHRVFDRRLSRPGGVILIDQSGSMRLTDEHIWDMIRAAPGCTIIGYSHEARSSGVANIWILARSGRVVDRVPHAHGGNGVDGPALEFAASLRRVHDPLIWVCDGYVTDAFDDHDDALTRACAALVTSLRVHQVPDVATALQALTSAARGKHLPICGVGPIASAMT